MSQRTKWLGRLLIGWDWADDGKWDWTSNRGDQHSDYASIAVCRRAGYPPLFRITIGPIAVTFADSTAPSMPCANCEDGDCTEHGVHP
ncbi:MAG TPA: hypothetical protein VIY73_18835 [Polyangiaceae bacterium]